MKINILLFGLIVFISSAYGQTVQKYVIDGKTYYGTPPAGLPKNVEVDRVRLNNTYVSPDDRESADKYINKANAEWNKDMKRINSRNADSQRSAERISDQIVNHGYRKGNDVQNTYGKPDWE